MVTNGSPSADIAQLGERQTEDLKVPGSIPGVGNMVLLRIFPFSRDRKYKLNFHVIVKASAR